MQKDLLKNYYMANKLDNLLPAIKIIEKMERLLHMDIDDTTEKEIDQFIKFLVEKKLNAVENFISLLRYYKITMKNDLFVYITKYTGPHDVINNIVSRMKEKVSILNGLAIPVLGTPPKDYPIFTSEFMQRLEIHFDDNELKNILIGNNHGILKSTFAKEKTFYQTSLSLETYLQDLHIRNISELQSYSDESKVWCEQKITQEVVDFVKKNQEIQSAVLKDNKLYVTKIPYDIEKYIHATTSLEKRYYACHCPFVRENIINPTLYISPKWCNCSAGYTKLLFDYILGSNLPIEILNSALDKDKFCRFVIDLSNIEYKK